MSSIKNILGVADRVSHAVSALGHASQAVPEVAGHFNGQAAAGIGMISEQSTPAFSGSSPVPFAPFYTPPVPVSEEDLMREADVRASFILARLRFGSSVTRNLVAEIITKSTDQQTVEAWDQNVGTPIEPGSMVGRAKRRLAIRDRLKNYKSPVTADDGDLVSMLKEGLYLDLKEQAQAGTFKKMSYEDMLKKLVTTEFFGLAEAIVEPLAELAKDTLAKK